MLLLSDCYLVLEASALAVEELDMEHQLPGEGTRRAREDVSLTVVIQHEGRLDLNGRKGILNDRVS